MDRKELHIKAPDSKTGEHDPAHAKQGGTASAPARLKRGRRSLTDINQVLSKLVNSMGLDRRLKEHALMNLWPLLIGESFAERSRPIFMDHENSLVVAVKDASTAQELSLMKIEILKKLRFAAHSIGIPVNGLRFDLKHFHKAAEQLFEGRTKHVSKPDPTPEQIEAIELDQAGQLELEQLKSRLAEGISPVSNFNERILAISERELKLRQWRRLNDFPSCTTCGSPTPSLHGSINECANCYFITINAELI